MKKDIQIILFCQTIAEYEGFVDENKSFIEKLKKYGEVIIPKPRLEKEYSEYAKLIYEQINKDKKYIVIGINLGYSVATYYSNTYPENCISVYIVIDKNSTDTDPIDKTKVRTIYYLDIDLKSITKSDNQIINYWKSGNFNEIYNNIYGFIESVKYKKNLKFIHITKCAGTAVENAGMEHNILWGRFHKEYGWHHRTFDTVDIKLKEKYDWFVIVRNPYDRILSEYYCKWGGVGNWDNGTFVHDTAEQMSEFLIKRILERNNASFKSKSHYIEQSKYIDQTTKIHILHFENLEEEFNKLMKSYQMSYIRLKKTNQKPNNVKYSIKDFSKKLIDVINNVYDKDFTIFGYDKIQN
jgi:hypothetical protein